MSVLKRRHASTLERLLGRRRARRLRRRFGFLALGTGFSLLKPTVYRTAMVVGVVGASGLVVLR